MKHVFIIKKNYPNLLVFFAGWGMDANPFLKYRPVDSDFMICYDYHSLDFEEKLLKAYSNVRVVAWSMGVWAASQVFARKHLTFTEAIAVNGTPYPIDNGRGIPEEIYDGTLKGLNESTLRKFQRRMCGSSRALNDFLEHAPDRTIKDVKGELEAIGNMARKYPPSGFQWDMAYIASEDKIFPPDNQIAAWAQTKCTLIDTPHFSEKIWSSLLHQIDND